MVQRGTRIRHAVVAVAAAVGRPEVAVHRRPKVACWPPETSWWTSICRPARMRFATPIAIRWRRRFTRLAARRCCCRWRATMPANWRSYCAKGLEADLLLLTGGVSMGKYDLVEEVLASLGARFFFTGVAIQPGKPVVFGEVALERQDHAILWSAGQSGIDDGHVPVVRAAGAGCAGRRNARATAVCPGDP